MSVVLVAAVASVTILTRCLGSQVLSKFLRQPGDVRLIVERVEECERIQGLTLRIRVQGLIIT